ncbi:MAG: hypothetical protein ACP5FH_03095, partial [Terracidiphilus sp.]
RIYAFDFATTEKQDDAFIARMNAAKNRSHFNLLLNNCSDFARRSLNFYFPHTFRRSLFPDAGITTPKQIAHKLERYARNHPGMELRVSEIPQVPGYRRESRSNKDIAESLTTTGYAVPLVLLSPYVAGGIFVDYLARGRYHILPQHPEIVEPDNLQALTAPFYPAQNSANLQAETSTAGSSQPATATSANFALPEAEGAHD